MDPAAVRRFADHLRAVRRGLADIRVSADSPDGLITATVDGRGALVALELHPRVYRSQDARDLGRRVVATVAEAARLAHDQAAALTRTALTGTTPVGSRGRRRTPPCSSG